jgi:uncharacterized membrane protein YfcA
VRRFVVAVVLGIAAGFIGGLFGVGGGLLMVPGLVLLAGFAQSRAHATSVTAIVAAATASVIPLALEHRVDWDTAALLLAGSLLGAATGARLIDHIPEVWLAGSFAALVVAAAARLAIDAGADSTAAATATAGFDVGVPGGFGLVAVGLAAGALAALLGIGGGILIVPALVALFSFDQHVAQGTSLAVIVPTAVVAAVVHIRAGRVDLRMAAALGAGGLAGGLAGATTALSLEGVVLARLFAVLLVVVAVRMLRRTIRVAGRAGPVSGGAAAEGCAPNATQQPDHPPR